MTPGRPLPYSDDHASVEDYMEKLLDFSSTSQIFQTLCGGIHILDFFITEPGLFHTVIPKEWQSFLLSCDTMRLLDFLLRDDLDNLNFEKGEGPPESFLDYVRSVRSLSLGRTYTPRKEKLFVLPRSVALGMKPKKVHEVTNFADYVERLSEDIKEQHGKPISHYVDFGSGQNYLGRALASAPYNRHVVAVEGREVNVTGAKNLDMSSGLAVKPKLRRNKKLWTKILKIAGPEAQADPAVLEKAIREVAGDEAFDFKPSIEYESEYKVEEGKGSVQYVSGRLDSGDLADVLAKVDRGDVEPSQDLRLMAISIHSCGNLSHFGIRSLLLNPDIRAVAIVGCCYNRMTERLGPPTYKHISLRPSLKALNGRVFRESQKNDPQGFPMSTRFATHRTEGVRLNITARMMACQAPMNWTRSDSEGFFTRHFYRAVLQKIFLDRGVVSVVRDGGCEEDDVVRPSDTRTVPVVIGSLPKAAYASLATYIRAAVAKLSLGDRSGSDEYKGCEEAMRTHMEPMTDAEIAAYETAYLPRRQEVCVLWTLMAFSAVAVESLIVADRWAYLQEHDDVVERSWVETIFDHKESPRNLVVVGVKREGASVGVDADLDG